MDRSLRSPSLWASVVWQPATCGTSQPFDCVTAAPSSWWFVLRIRPLLIHHTPLLLGILDRHQVDSSPRRRRREGTTAARTVIPPREVRICGSFSLARVAAGGPSALDTGARRQAPRKTDLRLRASLA